VRWFPRLRLRHPRPESVRRPDAACLRCGAGAPAGYVVATSRGAVDLGWITGEPGVEQWPEVVLDSRVVDQPARLPGHRCPRCGLVWLSLGSPDAGR